LAVIEAALEEYLTAYDLIGEDGRTIEGSGWEYGETLYANEIISLIDRVEGVKRVGAITYSTSDDLGSTWAAVASLVDIEPGNSALTSSDIIERFGLIHWGGEHLGASGLSFGVTQIP
jgi:hypothetical protein